MYDILFSYISNIRKKEIFPGQENSVEITATLIGSDKGNLTLQFFYFLEVYVRFKL
jgi:hypothetical protein